MTNRGFSARCLLVISLCVATPSVALAGGYDAEANALRDEGNAAMRSGRPADAFVAYDRVFAKTHDAAMLYNMARAQQALTNYPAAEDLLRRFRREAPPETLAKVRDLDRIIEEAAARVHTLTIRTPVKNAEVRLAGRIVGTTPLDGPLRVNAGPMEIDIRAEGYAAFHRKLELKGADASTLEVALVRLDTSGVVLVRSPNAGAAVKIDGQAAGNVPLELRLGPGSHEVIVSKEGYLPSKANVVVVTGETKSVDISLARKPSILTRWWFWTAIGVVAAGGTATYFALTTEKPAPVGSIPPGQVSFGLRY